MENDIKIEDQQVCIIKIVFPAVSDDVAFAAKKKIAEVMKDMPNTQINFNLIAGRPPIPS